MASLAWLFDCLDQQLFIMVRNSAMKALHPAGTDPTVLKSAGGMATHPAWYVNLARRPDDASLSRPGYGKYEVKTDREIPVVRLTRRPTAA